MDAWCNIRRHKLFCEGWIVGMKAHTLCELNVALFGFAREPEQVSTPSLVERFPVHQIVVSLCCVDSCMQGDLSGLSIGSRIDADAVTNNPHMLIGEAGK